MTNPSTLPTGKLLLEFSHTENKIERLLKRFLALEARRVSKGEGVPVSHTRPQSLNMRLATAIGRKMILQHTIEQRFKNL